FRWFGLAAFLLPPLLFFIGFRIAFKKSLVSLWRYSAFTLFFVIWLGLLLGYLVHISDDFNLLGFLSGRFGYELAVLASDFLGWGTLILIVCSLVIFIIFFINIEHIKWFTSSSQNASPTKGEDGFMDFSSASSGEEIIEEDEIDEEEKLPIDESTWTIKEE